MPPVRFTVLRQALRLLVVTALLFAAGPASAVKFLKGPYLQNVSETAITVMWETNEPEVGVVHWGTTTVYGSMVESPRATLHEVRLEGLEPSTIYHYTVVVGKKRSPDRRFTTAATAAEPFRFLVYGDNRDDHEAHRDVVDSMLPEQADLAFNTGDMVDDGTDEGEWQVFFDVERRLLAETTMFPVIGNHEARFDRGRALFRRFFSLPDDSPRPEEDYAVTYGSSRFIVMTAYARFPADQIRWLEDELDRTRADPAIQHRFVFLHHGPYSSGYHGGNAAALGAGLGRIMRAGDVDIVFSGHDHDYERGRANGLRYIVSGGGGAPLYDLDTKQRHQEAFEATLHFVRVDVVGDTIEITAIRPDSSVVDHCRTRGRDPWDCEAREPPPRDPAKQPVAQSRRPRPQTQVEGCPESTIAAGAVPLVALATVGVLATLRRRRKG